MLPEAPPSGAKFRILVVEDDVAIGRLLTANLSKAGFACRHVPDGGLGLAAFHEFNPHLVLLDLMMPVMDGRQVCARIRESSTVPVIMLTAMDKDEDQVQGLKLGADDYVTKPFNPALLVARVMTHLRRTYRYNDVEESPMAGRNTAERNTAPASAPQVPMGWTTCEGCGYMGPREKFESADVSGRSALKCPVCKEGNRLTFAIG